MTTITLENVRLLEEIKFDGVEDEIITQLFGNGGGEAHCSELQTIHNQDRFSVSIKAVQGDHSNEIGVNMTLKEPAVSCQEINSE